MKTEQDYINDIADIRSMMERSSKFLSLSGWAGILAGLFAMIGAYIAYSVYDFNPTQLYFKNSSLINVIYVAIGVLIISLISAMYLSNSRANKKGEKIWNATSRRLLINMFIPLLTGGVLILLSISKELIGLIIPLSLIFYGLVLYNASNFTIREVRILGYIQIILGLLNFWLLEYGILFWVIGFGVVHILYGLYMYIRFER